MHRHPWGGLFAFLLLTGSAWAQLPGNGNDAIALKRFEDGKAHYDAGEFELSLVDFQASMAIQPSPNSRLYIARCQRALGKIGSAFVSYRLAMREATDRLNTTGEKRYKATRDAAASEMAEIEAKVPRLTVTVPSDVPVDFLVKVDGNALPREAWGAALEVDPGTHAVTGEGARCRPFSAPLTLAEGDQKTIAVVAARVPTGTIKIILKTKPSGLSLQVDGKPIDASAPTTPLATDVGKHTLVVVAPGYEDFTWEGSVEDAQEVEILVEPRVARTAASDSVGTPRWVPLTLAGVGVAALGGGTIFALQAKSLSDGEKSKDPFLRDEGERDRARSLATRANVLFVSGGVLVLGAAILSFTTRWTTGDSTGEDTHAGITPWVSASSGGVAAWGAF